MIFPQIRCYHSRLIMQPHVFYILCKGENAGRPGFKPWVNSFAVICSNQQYFYFYFWLVYGLHKSSKFKIHLRGTAVPFLNLDDVQAVIRDLAPAVFPDWAKFQELVATMDKLEKLKSNLVQQVVVSENLQRHLILSYFEKVNKKVPR